MTKLKISIISIITNLILAGAKLFAGFVSVSASLIADGIHSGLDVLSSFITYFGIKVSEKQPDSKHPYGHHTAETLAGLIVSILLALSGIWIGYEGLEAVLGYTSIQLNIYSFIIAFLSIVINEIMAQYKFKIATKENSLALVADGQHSRTDAISSAGVLLGLFLSEFYPMADGVIAILIGLYILYESWDVGKETIDQLIGVNDEELENEIKNILNKEKIQLSKIKTRKIGSASFAEIVILLNPTLKIEEAEKTTKNIQTKLLSKIERLQHIAISVESHKYQESFVRTRLGQKIKWQRNYNLPNIPQKNKNTYRIIVPIEGNKIAKELGAPNFFLVDKEDQKIIHKKIVKNPYFSKESGHGMRFAKAVSADEIISTHIGEKAKKLAQNLNIKITPVNSDFDYENYQY